MYQVFQDPWELISSLACLCLVMFGIKGLSTSTLTISVKRGRFEEHAPSILMVAFYIVVIVFGIFGMPLISGKTFWSSYLGITARDF